MVDTFPSRQRWYVVGLGAFIILVVFAMATTSMPVLFSEIAEDLGLNIVQVGMVWGFSATASIFSILVAGLFADRFGARRTMTIACLLAGIFGASRGLSDSFLTLTVTSLLFGFASEVVPVIFIKSASQWFHGHGLGTVQGIGSASVGAGMMLGAMLSATLFSPLFGGWENVMFFYGVISALLGLLWFFTVRDPARAEPSGPTTLHAPRQSLISILRVRGVWLVSLAMMGFAGCNRGLVGYLPLYLRNNGWPAAAADGTLAALNAAGTAAAVPLTLLSDRLGLRKTILLPGLLVTVISVGLLSVVSGPAVWLLATLAGLARDMVWAVAATLMVETEGIGPAYAGTAVGTFHAFARVGYTFAPPVGNSLVAANRGLPFVFWGGLAAVALAAFSFVTETGKRRRRVTAG